MRTVWKTKINMSEKTIHEVPEGAKLLHVDEQYAMMHAWWEVDDDKPLTAVTTVIVGTGNEVPEMQDDHLVHVGTIPTAGGAFVWHIYMPSKEVFK